MFTSKQAVFLLDTSQIYAYLSHTEIVQYLEKNGFIHPELVSVHEIAQIQNQVNKQLRRMAVRSAGNQVYEHDVRLCFFAFDKSLNTEIDFHFTFSRKSYEGQFIPTRICAYSGVATDFVINLRGVNTGYKQVAEEISALGRKNEKAGHMYKDYNLEEFGNSAANGFNEKLTNLISNLRSSGYDAIKYGGGNHSIVDRIAALGKKVLDEELPGGHCQLGISGSFHEGGNLMHIKMILEMDLSYASCKVNAVQATVFKTTIAFLPGNKQIFETP